jgi:hypothetical protein
VNRLDAEQDEDDEEEQSNQGSIEQSHGLVISLGHSPLGCVVEDVVVLVPE